MSINFSSVMSGAGVQLEQQAYNAFGAAVNQFSQSALNSLGYGNQPQSSSLGYQRENIPYNFTSEWNGTNYAKDLITYQPKHRFLFRVLFEMDPNFTNLINGRKDVFEYVIRHIDRPKYTFDYEPVNMYNFKTKVLKTISHEPLSMTLIDDVSNTFHDFYRLHLMSYSPSSRTWNNASSVSQLEESGFSFMAPDTDQGFDSAIRGTLKGDVINPFRGIRLIQYFMGGGVSNTFHFVNPRITEISYDEVDHNHGDGHHATIRFDYDILYLEPAKTEFQRSPDAVPGSDMFSPQMESQYLVKPRSYNDSQQLGPGNFIGGLGGTGGFSPQSLLGSIGGGLNNNAMNQISAKALSNITNPILNNIGRNVLGQVSNTISREAMTKANTLFGKGTGGQPMIPSFKIPIIED